MTNVPTVNSDQRKLLDRVYNLKGDDSEILKAIRKKIEENKLANQTLTSQREDFQNQRDTKTSRQSELDSQYAKIISDFSGLTRDSYATVLDEAAEEFDPEAMIARLKEKIPARLAEIKKQIEDLESKIGETEKSLEENGIEAQELEGKLSDAEQMRERLAKLIDESLQGNGSITKDSIRELLVALGFNEMECVELGKMIMFPEGTLDAYDETYQRKNSGKSIADVFGDAKAKAEESVPDTKEKVVATEEVAAVEASKIPEEPSSDIASEPEAEPTPETKTDNYTDFYTETGIEKDELTPEAVAELASIANNDLIKKNHELLKSLEIPTSTVSTYYGVLADNELEEKIKFFQEIGKTSQDLALNFQVLLVYSYNDLKDLKAACDEYDIDFGSIPLGVLAQGLNNYFDNLEYLTGKNTELDRSELAKSAASLSVSTETFKNNFEMLTKYQYSLAKKNGKTAIQPLAQDSAALATGLDAVIETGEDEVFETAPEKLAIDLMALANRIAYCQKNGVPVRNENGTVHKFLFDEEEFASVFEGLNVSEIHELPTAEESTTALTTVLNESPLIDVLKTMDLNNVYLGERQINDEETYFASRTYIDKLAELENSTHRAYQIDGVVLSKERFERNLLFLINHQVTASSEEILAASLLYGSLKTESDMKKVADAMGFSEPAVGGVTL